MSIADIYVETLKGKKVAFVGMGVANTPCAEFWPKKVLKFMPVTGATEIISERKLATDLKT